MRRIFKEEMGNKCLPEFIQEKGKKILGLQAQLSDSLSATSVQMQNPQLLLSDLLVRSCVAFGILPPCFVPVLSRDAHVVCEGAMLMSLLTARRDRFCRLHSEPGKQSLLQFSCLNMRKES